MADDVTYTVNGKVVTAEEFRKPGKLKEGPPMAQSTTGWPMKSEAMGCHTTQITEFQDKLEAAGCPTEYTPDGRPILRSRQHRARVARTLGYFDKDAGYGDPAPLNTIKRR